MNREELKEQKVDQDFLEDAPTDLLIALATKYQTSTDYILGLTNDPEPAG